MSKLRLVAFSDYLCPWCYNGSVRLRKVVSEYDGQVELEYRSYLLRPEPGDRDLEKFRHYTRSWRRPGSEEDSGTFTVWASDEGPPSHSAPPHLVAKAAAELGEDAFWKIHEHLLYAYFGDNRDISNVDVLRAIWKDAQLPDAEFDRCREPALLKRVIDEHNQAIELGVNGVPSVMLEHQQVPIAGAQPVALYKRWLDRALEGAL